MTQFSVHRMVTMLCMGLVIGITALGSGCAACPTASSSLGDRWGIEITSLRMSGNGHLIDFRYRVLDPDKAALLGDKRFTPRMIDQASGRTLVVPNTPKIGPLRQSATRLTADKIYFMIFANSGRLVKAGSKVTIEIGEFRVADLVVQ